MARRYRMTGFLLLALLAAGCATTAPQCRMDGPTSEGRIAFDSPEPKYRDYLNKVREAIRANWIYPRQAGERGVEGNGQVDFDIAKDGRLTSVTLARSTGTAILEDAALLL